MDNKGNGVNMWYYALQPDFEAFLVIKQKGRSKLSYK